MIDFVAASTSGETLEAPRQGFRIRKQVTKVDSLTVLGIRVVWDRP